MSLEARLLLNFVGFFKSLLNSPNKEVAVAARLAGRDVRSSVGKNLVRIEQLTSLGDRMEAHYNANEEEATELSRLISSLVAN